MRGDERRRSGRGGKRRHDNKAGRQLVEVKTHRASSLPGVASNELRDLSGLSAPREELFGSGSLD